MRTSDTSELLSTDISTKVKYLFSSVQHFLIFYFLIIEDEISQLN